MPGTPEPAATRPTPPSGASRRRRRRSPRGDISAFHAEVDFAKLKAKTNDDMPGEPTGVPQTRRLRPHPRLALLRRPGRRLRDRRLRQLERMHRRDARPAAAVRDLRAQRRRSRAAAGALTLLLHSLSANYNQFAGSKNQSQFADRGGGSIVITPSGRGPDGWYYDHAGADTFEVWADVAAHYQLNPPSPTSPATRWAATARTSSRASSPTCSRARSRPSGRPALGIWVPPAEPQPGGEPVADRAHARLGAQRAVPDLGRDDRRARADRRRARTGRKRSTSSATATSSTSSRRAST